MSETNEKEIKVFCPDGDDKEIIKKIIMEISSILKGSRKLDEGAELKPIHRAEGAGFAAGDPGTLLDKVNPASRPMPALLLLRQDAWDEDVNEILQSPRFDVRGIFRMSKLKAETRDPEDFAALSAAVKELARKVLRSKGFSEDSLTLSKAVDWKARSEGDAGFISLFSDPATRRMAREYKDALLDLEANVPALKAFREGGAMGEMEGSAMENLESLCQKGGHKGDLLRECKRLLNKTAFNEFEGEDFRIPSLLLLGETGCGKTLLARSAARVLTNDKFQKVNISACTADAIDGLLFGWEEGAFTGSQADSPGIFIEHCGKTIFLDEIGDMNAESQTRLLTYMDDGRVRPMGMMGDAILAPCFLVAATNKNVDDPASGFRQDLVHRFDHVIRIPPLRERKQDLRLLISLTLQDDRINPPDNPNGGGGRLVKRISLDSIEYLEGCRFPGNFRELRSILRRAVNNAFAEGVSCLCLRHVVEALIPKASG